MKETVKTLKKDKGNGKREIKIIVMKQKARATVTWLANPSFLYTFFYMKNLSKRS